MNRKPNQTSFKKGHKPYPGAFAKGSKLSESAKELIRQSLLGKTGEQARNWQGGKTSEGQLIRSSRQFREWRTAVFERDNYTCQECGLRGVYLQADHIKPFAYFPELRFELSNGRTLCLDCHKQTDTFAYKAIKNYAKQSL